MRAQRWPQPDFMPEPRRPGLLMWLWLLVALAVLALLASQAWEQRAESAALDELAGLLDRLARQAKPQASAAQPKAAKAETQRKAWAVAAQLDTDWRGRWLSLEQAWPAGLQMQALEMDGGPALRIEGLASEMSAVTVLVDRLALQARAMSEGQGAQVELTRLQRAEGSEGLRFEIVRRGAGDNKDKP